MSTVEQARDVEIDRVHVEVEQRLQEIRSHPLRLRALVWQTIAQALLAIAAAVGAGIAIAPLFHR